MNYLSNLAGWKHHKRTMYVWNTVHNNRCNKYRTSKMTPKSDWLHLHDGCVMVSCHQVMIDFHGEHGEYSVANAICALMYSTVMTPDIWWTQTLRLYIDQWWHFIPTNWKMWVIVCARYTNIHVYEQLSVSRVWQSTIGYMNRFDDEYCMIALTDAYRIFNSNQHAFLCRWCFMCYYDNG